MNCDMCYIRLSPSEMEAQGRLRSLEEWSQAAEEIKNAGTLFLLLTGGEPLLYPEFKQLYLKLKDMGFVITINTNGTLIDEAWADFFSDHKLDALISHCTAQIIRRIESYAIIPAGLIK